MLYKRTSFNRCKRFSRRALWQALAAQDRSQGGGVVAAALAATPFYRYSDDSPLYPTESYGSFVTPLLIREVTNYFSAVTSSWSGREAQNDKRRYI